MDKTKRNLVLLHGGNIGTKCSCSWKYPLHVWESAEYDHGTYITGIKRSTITYNCPVCKKSVKIDRTSAVVVHNSQSNILTHLSVEERIALAKKILADYPEPTHFDRHGFKYMLAMYAFMIVAVVAFAIYIHH